MNENKKWFYSIIIFFISIIISFGIILIYFSMLYFITGMSFVFNDDYLTLIFFGGAIYGSSIILTTEIFTKIIKKKKDTY